MYQIHQVFSTLPPFSSELLWIVIVAFVVAFFLAFGVGANDVANSFGTSVGSKVLTLRQACILATIFEILGAVTLGYQVSSTIRTGMIEVEMFKGQTKLLAVGYLSALIGGAVWNLAATFMGLPVSGTHSIVGAIVGFSVVAKGFASIKWLNILKIVASWFISPISSGFFSIAVFLLILTFILKKEKPLEPGLRSLPLFYGFTVFINVFSIIHDGPHVFSYLTWWMALAIAFVAAILIGFCIWFLVVPRQRQAIYDKLNNLNNSLDETKGGISLTPVAVFESSQDEESKDNLSSEKVQTDLSNGETKKENFNGKVASEKKNEKHADLESAKISKEMQISEKPEVHHLFSYLQILTACFGAFAHGANDVSNAIGPLVAIVLIYIEGDINQVGETPWYLLLYGGVGISIGLWVWGRRVIQTMGQDLTKITPSSGFSIEIGAASTVLLASKVGLPISTTHCKVGSVVMVGRIRAKESVDWSLFRNIVIAWVLTVPVTALCSGGSMALLQLLV